MAATLVLEYVAFVVIVVTDTFHLKWITLLPLNLM